MKTSSFVGLGIIGVILTVAVNGALLVGAVWLIVKYLHWFGVLH